MLHATVNINQEQNDKVFSNLLCTNFSQFIQIDINEMELYPSGRIAVWVHNFLH